MFDNGLISPSALTEYLITEGFKTSSKNGKRILDYFSSAKEEYCALREGVGLRVMQEQSIIQLSGADALDYLHRISTNEIKNLEPFYVRGTVFVTEKGRILDSVEVINFGEKQILLGHEGSSDVLTKWIDKFIIADDVKVKNLSKEYSVMEFIGPQADSFITLLFGKQVENLEHLQAKEIFFDLSKYIIIKYRNRKNEFSYRVILTQEEAIRLITFARNNRGVFDFNLIGSAAHQLYRIKEGILCSNELNTSYNPLEAKLRDIISFTKGCYIGQEVIARLDSYDKIQKEVVAFEIDSVIEPKENLKLYDENNDEAGVITSLIADIESTKTFGIGYVKIPYVSNGRQLFIHEDAVSVRVKTKELPFS